MLFEVLLRTIDDATLNLSDHEEIGRGECAGGSELSLPPLLLSPASRSYSPRKSLSLQLITRVHQSTSPVTANFLSLVLL